MGDGLDGEDVPGVGGDYVGGDEIDLVGAVGDSVGGDAAAVGVPAFLLGAFDLDAAEAAAVVGGKVVGGGVSPGLGYAEAEFGGAGHETEFGPLSPGLGETDVHAFVVHGFDGAKLSWVLVRGYLVEFRLATKEVKSGGQECPPYTRTRGNRKRGRGGPRVFFLYYFYFINSAGVNRKGIGKYIWIRSLGLGGIGAIWGLDRKWPWGG